VPKLAKLKKLVTFGNFKIESYRRCQNRLLHQEQPPLCITSVMGAISGRDSQYCSITYLGLPKYRTKKEKLL